MAQHIVRRNAQRRERVDRDDLVLLGKFAALVGHFPGSGDGDRTICVFNHNVAAGDCQILWCRAVVRQVGRRSGDGDNRVVRYRIAVCSAQGDIGRGSEIRSRLVAAADGDVYHKAVSTSVGNRVGVTDTPSAVGILIHNLVADGDSDLAAIVFVQRLDCVCRRDHGVVSVSKTNGLRSRGCRPSGFVLQCRFHIVVDVIGERPRCGEIRAVRVGVRVGLRAYAVLFIRLPSQ